MRSHAAAAVVLAIGTFALGGCGDASPRFARATTTSDSGPIGPPGRGPHRGGNLVLLAKASADTGDPMVNYSIQFWQLYPVTYDGLTAFAKEGRDAGTRVVADLATRIPKPTDGGRTWTFAIRRGIRFSNGAELTPDDVKASFERIFRVKGPTAATFYREIDGAAACLTHPVGCRLDRGVVVDEAARTVTFHLTHADGEFLQKLAVPHASILPASVPDEDVGTNVAELPSTGPYYWASYNPTKQVVLRRNPHFHQWSARAQPDGYADTITVRYGLDPADQVNAIANGQGDYTLDPIPPERLNQISVDYPQQLHASPSAAVWYWSLNTQIPPFDNVDARRAVNEAFDRNAAVLTFGGPGTATPTCQVLPPGFPGYRPYCPYTGPGHASGSPWASPNMRRARELVAASGTAGATVDVVPSNDPVQKNMGQYLQTVLEQLGYRPRLKPLDESIQYSFVQNTRNRVGAALEVWSQDYPAASDFLHVLLACDAFTPDSDASPNIGGFCDRRIDQQMQRALRLQTTDVRAADVLWSRVDRAVTDAAAWIPMFNPRDVDFVSSRLGNYHWDATYLMLPSVVWVR